MSPHQHRIIVLSFIYSSFMVSCSGTEFDARYDAFEDRPILDATPLHCTLTSSRKFLAPNESVTVTAAIKGTAIKIMIDGKEVSLKKPTINKTISASQIVKADVIGLDGKVAHCDLALELDLGDEDPISCSLVASPSRISTNGTTELSLAFEGPVKTANIDGKFVELDSPVIERSLSASKTIMAQITSKKGKVASCSVNIGVNEDPIACTLTASPTSIAFNGSAVLKANVTGPVKKLFIDGNEVSLGSPEVTKSFSASQLVQAQVVAQNGAVAICSAQVTVGEEAISCSLLASPAQLSYNGETTLSVLPVGPVKSIILDGVSVVRANSVLKRTLKDSKTFTAQVTSEKGAVKTCQVLVTVDEEPVSCQLSASPAQVSYNQNAVITATFTGPVKSLSIAGSDVSLNAPTLTKKMTATQNVVAEVTSQGGKKSNCSVNIGVGEQPVSCTLTATPASIAFNGSTVLKANISGPVQNLTIDGQSVTLPATSITKNYQASKNIVATVKSPSGNSASCTVAVTVAEEPVTCQLDATPAQVDYNGTTQLRVSFTGPVQKVLIEGTEVNKSNAILSKTLASTKTFEAQVVSVGGKSSSCSKTVVVSEMPVSCKLTAAPANIAYNATTVVSLVPTGPVKSITIDGQAVNLTEPNLTLRLKASKTVLAEVTSNLGKKSSCSVNVGVEEEPISCTLSASPSTVPFNGSSLITLQKTGPVEKVRIAGNVVNTANSTFNLQNIQRSQGVLGEVESVEGNTANCEVNIALSNVDIIQSFTATSEKTASDIVFVIDMSASMSNEIDKIEANLTSFTNKLASDSRTQDFQLFVLAGKDDNRLTPPSALLTNPRFTFEENNHKVGSSDAIDVGLRFFKGVITTPKISLRQSSIKHMVFVSDDKPNSESLMRDYLASQRLNEEIHFHAIACTNGSGGCVEKGTGYINLVNDPKYLGLFQDLRTSNWSPLFDNLVSRISADADYTFALSGTVTSKLEVYVNGVKLDSTQYSHKNGKVTVKKSAASVGAGITIVY